MEAKVTSGPLDDDRTEDVLSLVAIAPPAIARWQRELQSFAAANSCKGRGDVRLYPIETAHQIEEGLLELRLIFENGDTLSMRIDSTEWCWPNGNCVQRN